MHQHTGESIGTNYNVNTYAHPGGGGRVEVEIWDEDGGYQRIWFNTDTLTDFKAALNDAHVRLDYPG